MTEAASLKIATKATTQPQPTPIARARHWAMALSFAVTVLLPTVAGGLYLFGVAADQYHSQAAFSIRAEGFSNPFSALSAFTQVGSTSGSEGAILYDYIQSQALVESVMGDVDLEAMFNRDPADFVFSLGRNQSIEKIVEYWTRMVTVSHDTASQIIEVEVHAFRPEDALAINRSILQHSADLMNKLSTIAREDTTRYALEDLATAEAGLKAIRQKVRTFRDENQIIDPQQGMQSQAGVLSALHSQLAAALVEKETILPTAMENDPRLEAIDRRISAIRSQISQERAAVNEAEDGDRPMSAIIGDYEALIVDLEFAQHAYTAALAAAEQARAEVRRQSRYMATHIPATLAQDSLYPNRPLLLALVFFASLMAWSVAILIFYNIRDRA
jgi:capsular polysaccharide transport system permease protein